MKQLRSFLTGITTPAFRKKISFIIKDTDAYILKTPLIGKIIWKNRFNKLYQAPSTVLIELTSICNAKCIMCPRQDMDRRMEVMDEKMYQKIVDQAAEMKVKKFALNGYGEIFTAKKHYKTYINYLLEKIPDAKIVINTNASLMKEEEAQFLIDKGIDTVHIDIDGATKNTFEQVRINLNFDDVVNNTRRLIELRDAQGKQYPKVRVGMIVQKENHHESKEHFEMWKDVADYTCSDYMVSRLGSVEKYLKERIVGHPCSLPFYELNIMSNGSAVMCCDDWNAEVSMGNINHMTLKEIWQGKKFREIRALQQAGRQSEISTCAKCDWARPGEPWFQLYREVISSDIQKLIPSDKQDEHHSGHKDKQKVIA